MSKSVFLVPALEHDVQTLSGRRALLDQRVTATASHDLRHAVVTKFFVKACQNSTFSNLN